jgi:hypothetical protein
MFRFADLRSRRDDPASTPRWIWSGALAAPFGSLFSYEGYPPHAVKIKPLILLDA